LIDYNTGIVNTKKKIGARFFYGIIANQTKKREAVKNTKKG